MAETYQKSKIKYERIATKLQIYIYENIFFYRDIPKIKNKVKE
jgi:hypothetical protein